ncbi:hypothetical protein BJ912DRAFT_866974 [Pholiota molesta]|nr:hypothetical protein BJ912DRAFT_866974 [Pholiota molesta]
MVNPGAFCGSRKEFLMSEKAAYSAGVTGGYAAEALALIQRHYFKRYPIDLPHEEEPPAESLEAVDDDAADYERFAPDPDRLTQEEYANAMAEIAERRVLINFRKAQIKRWMAYQYMKDNDLNPKESGAYNPYNAIFTKLTGKEVNRPRCKTAVNVWRKTHREEIEAELKRRLGDLAGKRDQLAAERDRIARAMFSKLDDEEQRQWKSAAQAEHNEAMKEYKKELDLAHTPSTSPEDRQRCIQGLVRFTQPILDSICAATGWKATLIVGGPEPAEDGRLNILRQVIHSGTTTGDVKLNFGRAERERYKKYLVPIFGSFLQKCYSDTSGHRANTAPADGPSASPPPRTDGTSTSGHRVNTAPVDLAMPPPAEHDDPFHSEAQTFPPAVVGPSSRIPSSAPPPESSRTRSPPPSPRRVPPPAPSPAPVPRSVAKPSDSETTGLDTVQTNSKRGTKRGRKAPNNSADQSTDESQRPKRAKRGGNISLPLVASTSAPLSTPVAFQAPADAPKWFTSALSMVQSTELGPAWTELIHKWSAFEAAAGYNEVAKLGALHRPTSVKDWIQRARNPAWKPAIHSPSKYGKDFQKWPGLNGLLSVISSLYHWGISLEKDGNEVKDPDWTAAVRDCTTVCSCLLG